MVKRGILSGISVNSLPLQVTLLPVQVHLLGQGQSIKQFSLPALLVLKASEPV